MRPAVTVLQLDTIFPRVPGDVGCPESYAAEVEIIRIPRATVARIVTDRPEAIDIAPFETAVRRARGEVIVTSCGFLAFWQDHLAALTDRPFIASSLGALDHLDARHAPGEIMVLTFDASRLSAAHFGRHAAHAAHVVGLEDGMHLRDVIRGNAPRLDTGVAARQIVDLVARHWTERHRALLLECTNLPPYRTALTRLTNAPVTDILTEIERRRPGTIAPEFAARPFEPAPCLDRGKGSGGE
ncbi:MAG: hypothetical protein WBA67_07335 [Jannaschia sp.]